MEKENLQVCRIMGEVKGPFPCDWQKRNQKDGRLSV